VTVLISARTIAYDGEVFLLFANNLIGYINPVLQETRNASRRK